ncbi:hypothetical protein IWW57_002865 [Coemansia sp. S610]|nr:hypothetical protein IWW57_002865 [Coemansia sp. S610]
MSEPLADVSETNGGDPQPLSSDTLQVGDTVSEALLQRLAKLEKYEHKLAEVARVYRNLNTARKAIETVLKRLTPIQSIAEVEELEAHLSNLNAKSQVAGEQIGALTERDKASRLKITDLETQLSALRGAEQERGSLAKELDKVTKERKVVEGQLERSNQKLRLDVKALQSEISELRATPAVPDVDTLATQLLSQVPAVSESEPLRELQTQLLVACGTPEGLVPATEVDEAVARASESHALELAQLKDILRKELATSEDRLKTASAESDKAIADLRLQLDSAPASEASGGGLTAERVGEIVAAALALKLELVSSEEPPPASQSVEVGGGKKKGKKKRKGTGTAPSPVVVPSEAVESDAAVKATQNEIAQLIALIESINDTSAKARESEATDTMVADLQAQIDQAQQSLSDQRQASDAQMALLSADVDAKALRIGELTEELRAAEARSSELTAELDTHKKRVDELAGALSATQEKCEKLTGELGAAEAKTVAIGEERTKLAQTLAKAQGASVRLEAQQSELQTQVTSLTKQLESARSRSNELQTSLERATADHAQAMARATAAEATVTGLEEHVRAVDADLANSRAQFADKSRALAQASAQSQELQYALEKERRALRIASDDAAKQATAAHERLAAAQADADAQSAKDREAIEGLRRKLSELDHSHALASRADRLEAQHAERQAELETMRQNLQRAEDTQTELRIEADRLRDIERDLQTANEQLARVTDERALSEQRWKRVHRDLKEELRRLQREKITAPPPLDDPPQSPSAPRSNSLTLASVSSLLRAATTANVSASAIAGRRASARPQPIAEVAEAATPVVAERLLPVHNHTRSVSNAASTVSSSSSSVSDALSNESNANVNVEYLRNVLFRFFNDKDRRNQLVPVLSTLLRSACTQCRLVRSNEHGATLDLYEEPSVYTTLANENNLGNHVLHIVKSKPTIPWRATYDMYLSTSVAPSSGVLVGRVVPTTVGGVYSILQRSTDPAQTQLADEVQWEEVCAVQYDSHVLGSTGPREMTVIVHAVSDDRGTGSLIDRYRAGADTDPGIVPLINKPPIYISETASYALDFGPRITTRSVKNFQLIHPHDKDYIVMQFGKSGPHSFALDIRYPMSPIMALGVAITSLDRKVIYNLSLPFFSSS